MRKIAIFLSIISIFLVSSIIVRAALPTQVSVTVTSSFDRLNKGVAHTPVPVNYGSEFTINAGDLQSTYEFQFWMLNGVVREDLPANLTIKARSNMSLHAVFSKTGEHAVLFVDSNGKLISLVYVAHTQTVVAPSYAGYTKPGQTINTTTPWKTLDGVSTLTNITSSRVYVLQYQTNTQEVTITLNNATVSSILKNINEVVTVTANNTSAFKYWKNASDEVVSYKPSFSFTATKNITLTAEEVDATKPATNLVTLSEDLEIRSGYNTFVGRFELLPGQSIHEFGFLVSKTDVNVSFETEDVQIVKSNAYNDLTNEFIMSFSVGSFMSVKAYIIVNNNNNLTSVVSSSSRSTNLYASDLFISEYIEGSSSNKSLEIYNGTGQSVDLSSYQLGIYTNGSTTGLFLQLTGILPHGETFVVSSSDANAAILAVTDLAIAFVSGQFAVSWNGDDAVALLKNNVVIDVVGKIGEDPGTLWSFGEGETYGATAEYTLVRKDTVTGPSSTWNTSEWQSYPQNTTTYLGSHTVSSVGLSSSEKALYDLSAISLPSVKKDINTISIDSSGTQGSIISYYSDSPEILTINGDQIDVTLPNGQPITVIVTVRVVNGASVLSKDFEITVGLTDQDKVDADAAALIVAESHTAPTTITLPTIGSNGSTILWTSSDNALINPATGAVVMPQSGQVVVTLTATLSLNAATKVQTFEVTLGTDTQPVVYSSDLFISYYMEGSVGNRKVIAVYNNTGATVDLTQYKIGSLNNLTAAPVAANIAGPALTGVLEHGKVLVIYHGDMINASNSAYIANFATDIAAIGNGNRAIAFGYAFNGTQGDIIAIAKNVDSVWTFVDVLGVWTTAVPSGTSAQWETDYTKDHTLIRNFSVLNPKTSTIWSEWEVLAANIYDTRMLSTRNPS